MRDAISTIGHRAGGTANRRARLHRACGVACSVAALLDATPVLAAAEAHIQATAVPAVQSLADLLAANRPGIRMAAPADGKPFGVIWFGGADSRPGSLILWGGPR